MKILVSGSTGLIGSALVPFLRRQHHEVTRLVRSRPESYQSAICWDPGADRVEPAGLEGFDAVVHLCGETLAEPNWNAAKKSRIRSSRIHSTKLLAETLAALSDRPKVLASASAIGFYGDRADEKLDEESPSGSGFLAGVCRDWEAATEPAAAAGTRVARMRTGLVLSMDGGVLAETIPMFRRRMGGKLGSGRQYVSWISHRDATAAIHHILTTDSLDGAVNLVSPHPVTNLDFTRVLGRLLRRPTLLSVPAWVLRAKLGEMADELVLSSVRAYPRKLLESGFSFHDPDLEQALSVLLTDQK
jgi:uncharacterized protein (TIGR01777 family)